METCFNTLDVGGRGGTTDFICEQQCRNPRVCSRTQWKFKEQNTTTSIEWNSDYGCKDGLTLGRLVIAIAVVRDRRENRRLMGVSVLPQTGSMDSEIKSFRNETTGLYTTKMLLCDFKVRITSLSNAKSSNLKITHLAM